MSSQGAEEARLLELIHAVFVDAAQRVAKSESRRHECERMVFWLEESGDDSVAHGLAQRLGKVQVRGPGVHYGPPFSLSPFESQCLRRVFYTSVADGLIVPGGPGQTDQPYGNARPATFTFTPQGLRFFAEQPIALIRSNALVDSLVELRARRADAVDDGQIALLGEAHRCWAQACYRAAVVLIGVANEDALTSMLDALGGYPAQSTAQPAKKDWERLTNPNNVISTRFESGLTILRRLSDKLRAEARAMKQSGKPSPAWADLWFRSVDSLAAVGEAVRCARNKAAHDADADFRRSDVALLLASTPTLLEHLADMTVFLKDVAKALDPIPPPVI